MDLHFSPYKASNQGLDETQVTQFCKSVNIGHHKLGLVSPFALYDDILSFLIRNPHFEIKPLGQLSNPITPKTRKNPNPVSRVGLRHDMDGDIITGLKCAQRLSARRIPGTFFVLHTSGYYGTFKEGVFHRYPGVSSIIEKFEPLKTEFGLHNDGLHFYLNHAVDGTEAVRTELAWLRELGLPTHAVVAHNSAPAYGAENFEMFEGLALENRNFVTFNNIDIPLQTLSLSSQDIHYEGNFSLPPFRKNMEKLDDYINDIESANIRNPSWQITHFLQNPTFERDYEVSIWLLAENSWLMAKHGSNAQVEDRYIYWPLSTQNLKHHLEGLTPGLRIMINIHPEYLAF